MYIHDGHAQKSHNKSQARQKHHLLVGDKVPIGSVAFAFLDVSLSHGLQNSQYLNIFRLCSWPFDQKQLEIDKAKDCMECAKLRYKMRFPWECTKKASLMCAADLKLIIQQYSSNGQKYHSVKLNNSLYRTLLKGVFSSNEKASGASKKICNR